MRILHAVYSLEMGGAEVLVHQLCRIQRAQGHQVQVVCYSMLGVIGEAMLAEGFDITVLGTAHPFKTMWRYFRRLSTLRPDVVHAHNVAPTTQAVIPARLAGVPCVISTRHRLELHPYDWKAELQYNGMGWFCDWVTGICEVTCENIRRGPMAAEAKIVRVYNGSEAVERAGAEEVAGLGKQPGKREFTAVFVGRVVKEKALDTLIRAVALARDAQVGAAGSMEAGSAAVAAPEIALWIVGDGKARPGLEALAAELGVSDRVRFWGQQTGTAPFFSGADAFCMSSISEGLPMSLLQSMSLGTPAVLTDVDGMGEILRLTGGGLLVPVGDATAFAAALLRLARDRALYEELSTKALAAYRAEFTLETMAAGYMALYRTRV